MKAVEVRMDTHLDAAGGCDHSVHRRLRERVEHPIRPAHEIGLQQIPVRVRSHVHYKSCYQRHLKAMIRLMKSLSSRVSFTALNTMLMDTAMINVLINMFGVSQCRSGSQRGSHITAN